MRESRFLPLLTFVLLAGCSESGLRTDLADCAAVTEPQDRLTCFDGLAATSGDVTATVDQVLPAVLELEAAIVFQSGDVRPVARRGFLVLPASFKMTMDLASVELPTSQYLPVETHYDAYAGVVRGFFSIWSGLEEYRSSADSLTASSAIAAFETDFEGKASVTLRPGAYFLFSAIEIGDNVIIWDLPLEVEAGKNRLVLDQNNAAYAL